MPSESLSTSGKLRMEDTTRTAPKKKVYHSRFTESASGLNDEAKPRKNARAKRFGIAAEEKASQSHDQARTFSDVEVPLLRFPPVTAAASGDVRSNAILVHGVDSMSTEDVFSYFEEYLPESLEWIDDYSCVVVWDAIPHADAAMKGLSQKLGYFVTVLQEPTTSSDESDSDRESKHKTYRKQPLSAMRHGSAGCDVWSIGLPTDNGGQVYFRQATDLDVKTTGAANRSMYYLKFGKNGQLARHGTAGIVSSTRKRKVEESRAMMQDKNNTDEMDVDDGVGDDDDQSNATQPAPLKIGAITTSKGEKRLKMYSDESSVGETVFKRLTADGASDTMSTDQSVLEGDSSSGSKGTTDLREMLRLKRLNKLRE